MQATFNFSTGCNTFNGDVGSVIIDYDDQELSVYDEDGVELKIFYVSKDKQELKRFHKALGNLIEEMDDE